MAANTQEEKSGTSPCEPKKPITSFPVDVIVLRLEVEDHSIVPQEADFHCSMATNAEGTSPQTLARLTGSRQFHDIKIETYSQAVSGSVARPAHDAPTTTDKLSFFSGIPSVEVVKGLLHLYKPSRSRSTSMNKSSPPGSAPMPSVAPSDSSDEGSLLCMLNIPAHMMLKDMLSFLLPALSTVTNLRVLRDSTPNQYMLLLTFTDKDSAKLFYKDYHGKPFNSLEPSACWLVRVIRVEVMKSSQGASLPSPDFVELPSCPVCLEKLDESVLTVLCNHSFHMQCLTRWEDSTCPICRYTQTPEPCTENICNSCDSKEDLWICLICGHVGCGRYVGRHAQLHYLETQHTFSMQLGRIQRVWDYIGDSYVHRLVQNKEDGKLVEVGTQGQLPSDQKMDSLQLEYSYLLSSQLETQRLFFEEKMACIEKDLSEQLKVAEGRCRAAVSSKEELEARVNELEREKKSSEKRNNQLQSKVSKFSADLKEEKELNKCLSTNQKLWKDRVEGLEHKIDVIIQQKEHEMKEMQEQVRDLMFYLETQKKVEDSPDGTRQELQEGHVVVPPTAMASSSATPRKPRKKK